MTKFLTTTRLLSPKVLISTLVLFALVVLSSILMFIQDLNAETAQRFTNNTITAFQIKEIFNDPGDISRDCNTSGNNCGYTLCRKDVCATFAPKDKNYNLENSDTPIKDLKANYNLATFKSPNAPAVHYADGCNINKLNSNLKSDECQVNRYDYADIGAKSRNLPRGFETRTADYNGDEDGVKACNSVHTGGTEGLGQKVGNWNNGYPLQEVNSDFLNDHKFVGVFYSNAGEGTAFAGGKNCDKLYTNAHLVIDKKTGKKKKNFKFKSYGPYKKVGAKVIKTGYDGNNDYSDPTKDWAILKLTPALPKKYCNKNIKFDFKSSDCKGFTYIVGNVSGVKSTMHMNVCKSYNKNNLYENSIEHNCKEHYGGSGAPVICVEDDVRRIIGINDGRRIPDWYKKLPIEKQVITPLEFKRRTWFSIAIPLKSTK